jgi:hypothetical protein
MAKKSQHFAVAGRREKGLQVAACAWNWDSDWNRKKAKDKLQVKTDL